MSDEALQRMFADACLREGAEAEITQDFAAYLRARGLAGEDLEAMLAAPARLTVYRRLVRNSLVGVVSRLLPRTRARANDAHGGAFDEAIARFLEERPPATHYLKDVPSEFLAWAAPRWERDGRVAPYLLDLARYELAHFELGAMPRGSEPSDLADVALDRPLAFSSVARLMAVGSAVHLLSHDEADRALPALGAWHLLVYRDADHAVRVLELGALAAAALAAMFAGSPLGDAVRTASAATGVELTDELLGQLAALLADLGERGVLLGARNG